jgi:hypothetical protein
MRDEADQAKGPARPTRRKKPTQAGARASNPLLADVEPLPASPAEGPAHEDPGESAGPLPHGVVCTVGLCPICTLVTVLSEARPELTGHLIAASRELLLALKVLIDARLQADEPAADPAALERIAIE